MNSIASRAPSIPTSKGAILRRSANIGRIAPWSVTRVCYSKSWSARALKSRRCTWLRAQPSAWPRGAPPLWSSDGWEPCLFALTVVFSLLIHFIRLKRRGRPKQPQVVPDPRLRYGQVVKQRAGRRLVAVRRRVIFGVEELIPLQQISTSLLERLNGTRRAARRTVASQDTEFRQVSDSAR